MNNTEPKFLHYLLSESGGQITAHCLDYDLVVSADGREEAIRRLHLLVRVHVETSRATNVPRALRHQAPDEYWARFADTLKENLEILKLEIFNDQTKGRPIGAIAASISHAEICATVNS
jgi:2-polyprenyl-6-methoxyphenol hydroxylase-like FAD-dependent oxidoreductase